jgi:hypothetical protein
LIDEGLTAAYAAVTISLASLVESSLQSPPPRGRVHSDRGTMAGLEGGRTLSQKPPVSAGTQQATPTTQRDEAPASSRDAFWTSRTLEELAKEQGVRPISDIGELMGGWPKDEIDDGFEDAVRAWRQGDLLLGHGQ